MAPNFQFKAPDVGFISQGANILGQGIASMPTVMDQDTKRQQAKEQLKQLKVDQQGADKMREALIIDKTVEYMEAAGLEGEEGRDRAFTVISQHVAPMYGSERQDPSKHLSRLIDDEARIDKSITKAKMERYRKDTSAQETVVEGGKAGTPEATGTVGVYDEGIKRTTAFPTSAEDMVQQAQGDVLSEPRLAPTVSREATADEAYEMARGMGIQDTPEVQQDVGYRGRKELTEGERPEGTYAETVAREAYEKPVVSDESIGYAETFPERPKPPSELDLLKIKAQMAKLRQAGRGDTANTDKNIREAQKRYDQLSSSLIKNTEKFNRLRQAKIKLDANKKLTIQEAMAISSSGLDPENVKTDELDVEIDKYGALVNETESVKDAAKVTIKELTQGKSLSQAKGSELKYSEEQEVKRKKKIAQDVNKARELGKGLFRGKYYDTIRNGTMEDVINVLPEELRESVREFTEAARSEGGDDVDLRRWFGGDSE